jgi:hypothetical protein
MKRMNEEDGFSLIEEIRGCYRAAQFTADDRAARLCLRSP